MLDRRQQGAHSKVADAEPVRIFAESIATGSEKEIDEDTVAITLKLSDGSIGTIHYLAVGDKSFPKERIEIFGGGAVAMLDDFRRLELVRDGRRRVIRTWFRQDKGHRAEWGAFARAITSGGESPICFRDLVASTLATLRILQSLNSGTPTSCDVDEFIHSCLQSAVGADSLQMAEAH